jgi:DNA repair exonuclease SbcCD ATPase subunit
MNLLSVRYKNFFSTGNDFTEIDITKYNRALIVGQNGDGKSTSGNAISFGLYGKTIKNVTKSQIVNSINGKNCLVEIEFIANSKKYLVRRGIKPNIFEIFEDNILVNQTLVLDYQGFLEDNVLKCSYRTFLQTCMISIENYTPFMSLVKSARRDFIEDILDIKVFTTMNQLVKANSTKNKDELKLLDVKVKNIQEKIVLQKKHIAQLEAIRLGSIDALNGKIAENILEIKTLSVIFDSSADIEKELADELKSLNEQKAIFNVAKFSVREIQTKMQTNKKDAEFFSLHTDCPTCRQGIDKGHIEGILETQKQTNTQLSSKLTQLTKECMLYINLESNFSANSDKTNKHSSSIIIANSVISRHNKIINDLKIEKANLKDSVNVLTENKELAVSIDNELELKDRQTELKEEQDYNLIMLELFKDTGIKSKIVDQYLPVINKLSNEYLNMFDFFVSFNLDAEFTETIKSRHRDSFTYSSFSAGERMKIDLALMFTFRQLASMRNSFSCNLLYLDELLDSSIDASSVDLLMNIFDSEEFSKTNLMVISHSNKEKFEEKFDASYKFYKRDGFSQHTESVL